MNCFSKVLNISISQQKFCESIYLGNSLSARQIGQGGTKEDCIQTMQFWDGKPGSSWKLYVQPHWSRRILVFFEITWDYGDVGVLEVDWYTVFRNGSYLKTAERLTSLSAELPDIENISLGWELAPGSARSLLFLLLGMGDRLGRSD